MLNQDTKRRIDSARDILVGKVPDPKAQVEQITTALIYKFMDDMDKESEELGGEASFFVDGYQQYAWSKLLDPRLGGFDRLSMYVEALTKMPQNPHLPQLFRDIFKDAFLPYRDPETLNLFLKEINGFTYDHSENLGNAFEYLLSVMDSQGDAGQFRTPRHIIDFIVKVVDPKKEDTVLDPACGTAGFLISAFKHILQQNSVKRSGDQLTPDERTQLMRHFVGYDISPDMVRLSLVNMYLHGFPNPNIREYDTLTSEERWDEHYEVIMANPPFMTPKGGIRPHKRFSIQASRSEVLFVDYIAEHLTIHGRAGVIVPEGIIFQSGSAYKALRRMLVEKYVWAVVSLPGGVFQPYSGVRTSILLIDKQLAKKADNIIFVKVENDGFDLGAQRRPIDKNDLTHALVILQQYKQAVQNGENPITILSSEESEASNMAIIGGKAQIAKNGDHNLSGERYRESLVRLQQQWPLVELDEIVEINPSKSSLKDIDENTLVSFVPMSDLKVRRANFTHSQARKVGEVIKGYTYFAEDDILLAKITPCFENGKIGIAHNLVNKIGFGSTEFIVLRANKNVLPIYLFYLLSQPELVEQGKAHMTGSAGQQRVPVDFIKSYNIPLPPVEVQQEIVAELDSYQKIIDGARRVVTNYKPAIKIDPHWEKKSLQEVCEKITDGTHQTPQYENSGVIFLSSKNVTSRKIDWEDIKYISQELHEELSKRVKPQKNDILLAKNGTTGVAAIVDRDVVFDIYVSLALLRPSQIIAPNYLLHIINSDLVKRQFDARLRGIGVPNLHLIEIKSVKIPVPPLPVQKQIVEQIEEEQRLVEANKKLIEIFEQKIKDKIAEVWGELEASEAEVKMPPQFGTFKQAQQAQQAEALQGELGLA